MKCRCPSESHGYKAGMCKNLATEPNQMCKPCYDQTAKEIHDPGSPIPSGPKKRRGGMRSSRTLTYGRETKADADIAILTMDEARRIASNIAKLPKATRQGKQDF
jgi:hypothetical protein